jgi:hypothetical protein
MAAGASDAEKTMFDFLFSAFAALDSCLVKTCSGIILHYGLVTTG